MEKRNIHSQLYDMGEKIGGSAKDRYSGGEKKNTSSSKKKPIFFALDIFDGTIYASYYKNSNCRRIGFSRFGAPQILWKRQGIPFVKVGRINDFESFIKLGKETEYCPSSDTIKKREPSNKREEIRLYEQYSMWLYTSQLQYLETHKYDRNSDLSIRDYCMCEAKRLLIASSDFKKTQKKNVLLRIRQGVGKKKTCDLIASYRSTFYNGDWVIVLNESEVSSILGIANENNNITSEMLYPYVKAYEEDLMDKARNLLEEKFGSFSQEMARLVASKRLGTNWRDDKDATEDDFLKLFGFRAVEFGETMPQKERREHFNRTYDALMDLVEICGLLPADVSLRGSLGICFGSRGHGVAGAHYEPTKKVINLTRRYGRGCLAHEWFHALDHMLSTRPLSSLDSMRQYDSNIQRNYSFDKNTYRYILKSIMKEEFTQVCSGLDVSIAVAALYYTFRNSSFYIMSQKMDRITRRRASTGIGGYWTQPTELGARAFEYYIIEKLKENGRINEYLAQIPEYKGREAFPYPIKHKEDMTSDDNIEHNRLMKAFDLLFTCLQRRNQI